MPYSFGRLKTEETNTPTALGVRQQQQKNKTKRSLTGHCIWRLHGHFLTFDRIALHTAPPKRKKNKRISGWHSPQKNKLLELLPSCNDDWRWFRLWFVSLSPASKVMPSCSKVQSFQCSCCQHQHRPCGCIISVWKTNWATATKPYDIPWNPGWFII